jgi:hypothetical protein
VQAALSLWYGGWSTQPGHFLCNGPRRSAIVPLTNFIKNFNFSVLSLRAAGKMSSGYPNEVDTSLVKSQLIYWQQEIKLLHLN